MSELGQTEARIQELLPDLPLVAGKQELGISFVTFPGSLTGGWNGSRAAETCVESSGLACSAITQPCCFATPWRARAVAAA